MTADPKSIGLSEFMAVHLQRAEPDLLRSLLQTFAAALMGAEADEVVEPRGKNREFADVDGGAPS
jgi:hypothetical protein